MRDQVLARQREAGGDKAGVDYVFEIAADLSEALFGFRDDGQTEVNGRIPMTLLEETLSVELPAQPLQRATESNAARNGERGGIVRLLTNLFRRG